MAVISRDGVAILYDKAFDRHDLCLTVSLPNMYMASGPVAGRTEMEFYVSLVIL